MKQQFKTFKDIVERSSTFLLTTHVNPDGDGIGSELALASFLQKKGKVVRIVNHSRTPPNYLFLDAKRLVEQFEEEKHSAVLAAAEVIVVLDTNHPDRLVSMKELFLQSKAYKVCIDHHLDAAKFADLYIIDDTSTATGEIIYQLFMFLDRHAISQDVARFLYTAIMTDTGSFHYPKTDAETHKITSHLIEQGADPVAIYDQVYDQGTSGRLRLLGLSLANLQVVHEGSVAYLVVTQRMLTETGTTEVDTDAFVPYTLSIEGVKIGMMFTELGDGVKVNFRSKGEIRINELAKEFGGNGHKNAAGARMHNVRLDDVLSRVVERSGSYLNGR